MFIASYKSKEWLIVNYVINANGGNYDNNMSMKTTLICSNVSISTILQLCVTSMAIF